MFAVPGWAVSAASLVREQSRSKTNGAKQNTNSQPSSSKKRKRNSIPSSDQIKGSDPQIKLSPQVTSNTQSSHTPRRQKPSGKSTFTQVKPRPEVGELPNIDVIRLQRGVEDGNSSKDRQKGEHERANFALQDDGTETSMSRSNRKALSAPPAASTTHLTPLQAKMRSKLTSARFRHLNETLYTTTSSEALNLFTSSPELFADYHAGFAQQVKDSWPQNPVEMYIQSVKSRGALSEPKQDLLPLPRRKTGSCTIADLGCGDAPLARGCQAKIRAFSLKFHNFDLHAPNTFVIKADMSSLPLRDGEADIAVFCLSLMGTNWINFVEEAWRILRGDGKGEVWVAEVKSRFGRVTKGRVVENSVGKRRKKINSRHEDGVDDDHRQEVLAEDERALPEEDDETDVSAFIKVFTRRGYQLRENSINKRNKMFVSMIFTKTGIPTAGKYRGLKWTGREYQKQPDGKVGFTRGRNDSEEVTPEQEAKVLKPCVYKTR